MRTIHWVASLPASLHDLVRGGVLIDNKANRLAAVLDLTPAQMQRLIERAGEIAHGSRGLSTLDVLETMYELACEGATAEQLRTIDFDRLQSAHYARRYGILDPAKDPLTQAERDLEIPR